MKKIMKVGLVFESNPYGVIIVGTNPEFDNLSYGEINKIIGGGILIK